MGVANKTELCSKPTMAPTGEVHAAGCRSVAETEVTTATAPAQAPWQPPCQPGRERECGQYSAEQILSYLAVKEPGFRNSLPVSEQDAWNLANHIVESVDAGTASISWRELSSKGVTRESVLNWGNALEAAFYRAKADTIERGSPFGSSAERRTLEDIATSVASGLRREPAALREPWEMLSARLPSMRRVVDLDDARERIKRIKTGGPDATGYAKRVVELTQAQPQPFSNDELGLRQGQSVDDLLAEALAARREQIRAGAKEAGTQLDALGAQGDQWAFGTLMKISSRVRQVRDAIEQGVTPSELGRTPAQLKRALLNAAENEMSAVERSTKSSVNSAWLTDVPLLVKYQGVTWPELGFDHEPHFQSWLDALGNKRDPVNPRRAIAR